MIQGLFHGVDLFAIFRSAIDYATEENHQEIVDLLNQKMGNTEKLDIPGMIKKIRELTFEQERHLLQIRQLEIANQNLTKANTNLKKENARMENTISELKNSVVTLTPKPLDIKIVDAGEFTDKESAFSYYRKVTKNKVEVFLKKEWRDIKNPSLFLEQGIILPDVQHPCIIKIVAMTTGNNYQYPGYYFPCLPFHLYEAINKNILSNDQKNLITVEIVLAMRYIHQNHILHRNLNPIDIFLTSEKNAKLGGFDFSAGEDNRDSLIENKNWLEVCFSKPPELLSTNNRFTRKSDVYSFGAILNFILTGNSPKINRSVATSYGSIKMPKVSPTWVRDLLTSTLAYDPQSRPSFDEIFQTMKSSNYDLFHDNKNGTKNEAIEKRILEVNTYELARQLSSKKS